MTDKLLEIRNLSASYGQSSTIADVSLDIKVSEIVCIAGESGCGKSTLLKSILDAKEFGIKITNGEILFRGKNIFQMNQNDKRLLLGGKIGFVPQNPKSSFNEIRRFDRQFKEAFISHGMEYSSEKILRVFEKVNLQDGARILKSCPYEMSGGMNQRIALALAILLEPEILLCDEATSALDVTTQKQIAEELLAIRKMQHIAMLIVTHDLGFASGVADKIGIMYAGHIIEYGTASSVLRYPVHPYTKSLIAAIPDLSGTVPMGIDGQPPLSGAASADCAFKQRCPVADYTVNHHDYELRKVGDGHFACCKGVCE